MTTARLCSLLFFAILLSGLNMRPMLTSMGPVLDDIRASLDLSPSVAGLLGALPVLCFGVCSIVIPRLARRMPVRRVIVAGLLVLATGVALRSMLGSAGLFTGILVASAGISAIMVMIPAITKSLFSHRLNLAMGFYTMSFCLGASLGAGLAVPLAQLPHSSWRWSLAFWLLPALVAAAAWCRVPSASLPPHTPPSEASISWRALYRDRLAWQVTLFMGLQSCLGQSLITWLPAILTDRGMTPAHAGAALSIALLVQLITAFATPWLAMRGRDQRTMIIVMSVLMIAGPLGTIYAPPNTVWVWVIIMGLGMGGIFSLALSMLVLRTRSTLQASALSGMAQGIGYTIGAIGPVLTGILYERSQNWHTVAVLFATLGLINWMVGMRAGQNKTILTLKQN